MGREGLKSRLERFEELERLLTDPQVLSDARLVKGYAKEHAALRPFAQTYRELKHLQAEMVKTETLLESDEPQAEMRALAEAELKTLQEKMRQLEQELEGFLIEQDPNDQRNVIVEIRPGTGGAEASLFAADLYRMYTRFAARNDWRVEPLGLSPTEVGGFKEAIFAVEGPSVFRRLKYESGVHRVQRVPATEASGRIHTSTVTVAVLPQAEEVEVQIDPKDLRIDVFRSSGPGGQSVNTTDSAVRITHLATGIVVSCQDERSQLKNKAKGMKVLRARLLERMTMEQAAKRTLERRAQIGTGDRSEKIRTYNFPDRRVTDHRIDFSSYRLEAFLNGELEELVNPLLEAERKAKLGTTP